jgi:hypothetical protein
MGSSSPSLALTLRLSTPHPFFFLPGSCCNPTYSADRGKDSRVHSIRQWLDRLLQIVLSEPLFYESRIIIDFIRSSNSGHSASSIVCSVHVPVGRFEAVASPNFIKWRQCPDVSGTICLLSFLISTLPSIIVPNSSEWLLVNTISGRRA